MMHLLCVSHAVLVVDVIFVAGVGVGVGTGLGVEVGVVLGVGVAREAVWSVTRGIAVCSNVELSEDVVLRIELVSAEANGSVENCVMVVKILI